MEKRLVALKSRLAALQDAPADADVSAAVEALNLEIVATMEEQRVYETEMYYKVSEVSSSRYGNVDRFLNPKPETLNLAAPEEQCGGVERGSVGCDSIKASGEEDRGQAEEIPLLPGFPARRGSESVCQSHARRWAESQPVRGAQGSWDYATALGQDT